MRRHFRLLVTGGAILFAAACTAGPSPDLEPAETADEAPGQDALELDVDELAAVADVGSDEWDTTEVRNWSSAHELLASLAAVTTTGGVYGDRFAGVLKDPVTRTWLVHEPAGLGQRTVIVGRYLSDQDADGAVLTGAFDLVTAPHEGFDERDSQRDGDVDRVTLTDPSDERELVWLWTVHRDVLVAVSAMGEAPRATADATWLLDQVIVALEETP